MKNHEYKGYILEIESYLADTADGFNHTHYLGRCEELGFESREHEYSRLVYSNFYRAVDKKLNELEVEKENSIKALLDEKDRRIVELELLVKKEEDEEELAKYGHEILAQDLFNSMLRYYPEVLPEVIELLDRLHNQYRGKIK